MRTARFALLLLVAGCLVAAGCGGSEEETAGVEQGGTAGVEGAQVRRPLDEETEAAARGRGVPEVEAGEGPRPTAKVLMTELTYEWRVQPDVGLHVVLSFMNQAAGQERARGYVFLIAKSIMPGYPVQGVYPWDAVVEGDEPTDYTDGTHLLFRDKQQIRAFVPYEETDGHYQTLRLMVYSEGGDLVINRSFDLEVTGTSGQSFTVNPDFDL